MGMPSHHLNDIPLDLMQRCRQLVQLWHKKQPVDFDKVIWNRETMAVIMAIEETRTLLETARRAWRRKTKDESLMAACSVVLALEILQSDFMGWGKEFPQAQEHANQLLTSHAPDDRQRMIEIFKISDKEQDSDFSNLINYLFDPNKKVFAS